MGLPPERSKRKRRWLYAIGLSLIGTSYLFCGLSLLFAALAIGARTWWWAHLAVVVYFGNWVLFGAGALLVGPGVARSGWRWLLNRLRRDRSQRP